LASTTGKPLDAEWTRWLHLNIQRGCAIDELRGILRSNGFSDASIEAGIKSAGKEVPGHVPMPIIVPEIPRANLKLPNAVAQGGEKAQLYTVDDFLSRDECERSSHSSARSCVPLTISTPRGGEYDKAFRTSRTCDLSDAIPAMRRLDAKICAKRSASTRSMARAHAGPALRDRQVFKTHTDFFKPYELEKYAMARSRPRHVDVHDLPERAGRRRRDGVSRPGHEGRAKRGRAVVWNNLHASGQGNDATRHQSLPVTAGTKTIITKWFRMPRPAGEEAGDGGRLARAPQRKPLDEDVDRAGFTITARARLCSIEGAEKGSLRSHGSR
jgi:prolyl 4-hydroxylase